MNPRHPIYIVSKGRWAFAQRLTSRALHEMGVRHFIIVEAAEAEAYRSAVEPSAEVLVLDPEYQRSYDTCMPPGVVAPSPGSGPARNFAWDHAAAAGAEWHWVGDDNIQRFYRLNRNAKVPVADGTILRAMEAFVERYENVAMAGPNYESFVRRRMEWPPFQLNTRIYSWNLIRTGLPYRWRARYNEDTDLSVRMLKDGWCTILFNAFLQNKLATQRMAGGNTDEFYAEEGTLPKSEMLQRLHPDVAKVVWRFERWHHFIDYSRFTTPLRLRPGVEVLPGVDNFGMILEQRDPATGVWESLEPDYPWEVLA